jgi:hypothetical protein
MRTGRFRALTALVFALCVLCHLIVAFFAIVGAGLLFLFYADRRRAWWAASVGIVGGLLTAFWILPFWYRGPFMTDMFYERRTDFMKMFFPQSPFWNVMISGLAILGVVGAIVRRQRPGMWLGALCLFYGLWARLWPQSHLWNARLLPFFYLTRYLLVVLGVVEVGRAVGRLVSPDNERVDEIARVATLGFGVLFALLALGLHLENIPGLSQYYDASAKRWEYGIKSMNLGVKSQPAFVDDWAKWNYAGYEGKDAYGEYYTVVNTMKQIGETRGCGRALWENNNDEDKYGTPMALMLLPFWTNGCIGSMEGLYFEAAATTPYHFLTTSAMSQHSSNPVRRLRYEDGDVDKGVQYMQALGVRYYLAYDSAVTTKADANPNLTQIGSAGPWKIYEVKQHDIVEPLTTQPVVVKGLPNSPLKQRQSKDRWLEVGTSWFQDQSGWAALPAENGPASWQRITTKVLPDSSGVVRQTDDTYLAQVGPETAINPVSLPAATVTDVKTGDDSISFKVDKPGVPILVKVSYFPNWKVSNADGPYRVAPNMMVVVPKKAGTVRLHYGYTPIDVFAYFLTFLGIAGLFVLWRLGPVNYKRKAVALADTAPADVDDEPVLWFEWDEPDVAFAPPPPAAGQAFANWAPPGTNGNGNGAGPPGEHDLVDAEPEPDTDRIPVIDAAPGGLDGEVSPEDRGPAEHDEVAAQGHNVPALDHELAAPDDHETPPDDHESSFADHEEPAVDHEAGAVDAGAPEQSLDAGEDAARDDREPPTAWPAPEPTAGPSTSDGATDR